MSSQIVTAQYPWYPWDCRGWPFTAAEEQRFVADLNRLSKNTPAGFERGHVTVLMNALRSGQPVAAVRRVLPRISVASLRSAYVFLDEQLSDGLVAWQEFLADPHEHRLVSNAQAMSVVLPVPFGVVLHHLHPQAPTHSAADLAGVITDIASAIDRTTGRVRALERRLEVASSVKEKREIGYALFNPFDEHEWQNPYFLPERVGQLSLMRVADILGEVRD